ncbi:MAG: sulfatase [Lentisphaerae bacterium]|nr:sulfatase [Lentisphaerota bacterium]MBT4817197.1 sulfatase [Lentisphaerota bacterium]MBT5609389.1 sulfatase [Lentisphaerota bacterium]MBT7057807.1 sulfatase [Lentisphaerota bacterium]MBT7843484.1 sulfatase [Lentisphaerota bacterium]
MEADLETWCADVEQDRTRHSPIPGPACPALPDVPNILFILVDDLGWADLGCYGHPWHDTPALNSLASDGIRFTQGYAPAPICSASRSGILTGKAPARLGFEFVIKDEVIPQKAQPGQRLQTPPFTIDLPLDEKVIPAYLGEAGYNTAFFGKWHMNQHYRGYLGWRPTHGPLQRGFQHAIEDFGSHPYSYRKCGEPDPVTEPGVLPADAVTDHAIDFLRRRGTAPFFLMVSHFYVHTPVKTPCRWLLDKYEAKVPADAPNRGKRVAYAAFLETLDRYVGHLLTALDDERLRDNTLVVFMSDNGGHPEYTGHTPLRGSKWNLYEGGVRVPFLVRWPGEIPGGAVCDTPVTGCDLLPTFTELAGRPVDRAASNLDGDSLLALFRDPSATLQRDLYWHFPYYHPGDGYADVCQEIGISDFALSQTRPHSAIRRGDRKLLRFYEDSRAELYDLARDVGEQNDRSAMDSRQAAELDESLTDLLAQANARFPVPLPPE